MTDGATIERNSSPPFATSIFTLRSSKLVAYWRRVISSKFGCLHEPGVASCCFWALGVEGADAGVAGALMGVVFTNWLIVTRQ